MPGNYRRVLSDCAAALRLDLTNIKAFFRSTKALLALDRVDEALDCCDLGLQQDPKNAALKGLRNNVVKRKQELEEMEVKRKQKEEKKKEEETRLADTIKVWFVGSLICGHKEDNSRKSMPGTRRPISNIKTTNSQIKLRFGRRVHPATLLQPKPGLVPPCQTHRIRSTNMARYIPLPRTQRVRLDRRVCRRLDVWRSHRFHVWT